MPRLNGTLSALAILATTTFALPAGAVSVPDDFCTGDPCVVTADLTADAGSIVDFGARDLVIAGSSQIDVGAGALPRVLTLIAASIRMEAGAKIRGDSADRAVVTLESTTGSVILESAGSNRSEINVKSDATDAGSIIIRAATDAIIGGRLTASAQGEDATGGTIEIISGGMTSITEECTTAGSGSFAGAGEFSVSAEGDVMVLNKVFADGADFGGGDVSLTSTTGSIMVSELINNNGGDPDGEAGEFTFTAGMDIHITADGELRGKGGAGADEDCGDGAPTFLSAGRDIIIDGFLALSGGFQCFGGEVDASAGQDFVQNGNGKIETATGGGFAGGGFVTIAAARAASTLQIDASSAGFGGEIDIVAGLVIDVHDKLNAKATGAEGVGAKVKLTSCEVNVLEPDGELDSRGPFAFPGFGVNEIFVSGTGSIGGDINSATGNTIFHLSAIPPTVTASADPPFTFVMDPTLTPCANTCGDGSQEPPEICDDGNLLSCDGCSSSCVPDDICGDGIVECGEQCDDGNSIPGDGCENDCTPTGQTETGVFIEGQGNKVGCQSEWLVSIGDPDTDKKGKPSRKQACIDGDPRCDVDGEVNSSCTLMARPCFNVPDEDLPDCDPASRVERIQLKKPLPGSNNPVDDANAQAIVDSLVTLGTQVEADGTIYSSGGPISGETVCGPPVELVVPFSGKSAKKTFKLRTDNEAGQTLKKAQIQYKCERNNDICGDGMLGVAEICDDGNIDACDGCFACKPEVCGNGRVDCMEQCDEGELNGTEGSECTAECTIKPPELRIPGGGSRKTDCMWQWSMDIGAGDLLTDKRGVARNKQTCRDNSPFCDYDPSPGNCRVRLFGCAGAENTDLTCVAQSVDSIDLKRPKDNAKKAFELAARSVMAPALDDLFSGGTIPAGDETCTNGMMIDIPQGEKLRISVKAFGAKKDGDSLRLTCE